MFEELSNVAHRRRVQFGGDDQRSPFQLVPQRTGDGRQGRWLYRYFGFRDCRPRAPLLQQPAGFADMGGRGAAAAADDTGARVGDLQQQMGKVAGVIPKAGQAFLHRGITFIGTDIQGLFQGRQRLYLPQQMIGAGHTVKTQGVDLRVVLQFQKQLPAGDARPGEALRIHGEADDDRCIGAAVLDVSGGLPDAGGAFQRLEKKVGQAALQKNVDDLPISLETLGRIAAHRPQIGKDQGAGALGRARGVAAGGGEHFFQPASQSVGCGAEGVGLDGVCSRRQVFPVDALNQPGVGEIQQFIANAAAALLPGAVGAEGAVHQQRLRFQTFLKVHASAPSTSLAISTACLASLA